MKRVSNPFATSLAVLFLGFLAYQLLNHFPTWESFTSTLLASLRTPLANMNAVYFIVGGILVICAIAQVVEEIGAFRARSDGPQAVQSPQAAQSVINIQVTPNATPSEVVKVAEAEPAMRDNTPHVAPVSTPVTAEVKESSDTKTLA